MLIAVLLFSETTLNKLAEHRITPEEIRQVNDGDRIVIRNPRPRVERSVLMIGPIHGGRVLTVCSTRTRSTTARGKFVLHGARALRRSAATSVTASAASCSHAAG